MMLTKIFTKKNVFHIKSSLKHPLHTSLNPIHAFLKKDISLLLLLNSLSFNPYNNKKNIFWDIEVT